MFSDFNDIAFLVLFDWDSAENEAIYIIPAELNVAASDIQTISKTDSDDTALQTDDGRLVNFKSNDIPVNGNSNIGLR